jgi:hypothetical protein
MMCLLLLAGCGSSPGATTTGPAANNTVAITGPNGQPAGNLLNGLYTTVTVCQHGTPNCETINNVLVDTGSIGLRLAQGTLGSVTLTPISQTGSALEECIQYGDTSYSWGPMELADVHIAGETALDIPVQLLGATTAAAPPSCLTNTVNPNLPNGGDEDTPTTLGANGILGIANGGAAGPWDCGSFCTTTAINLYYTCPGGTCQEVAVPVNDQAINPVAAFVSSDNNGMMITLPSVGPTGAVTVSGTMNFGIGTQSDNALPNVTVYAMDDCGDFPTVTFNGSVYEDTFCNSNGGSGGMGGFVDTGSNALYVSDANTLFSEGLPISDCANGNGFYCVTGGGTVMLSNIALFGNGNVGSGTVSLSITDAPTLFNTNNAVFNNLGGDSGTSISTDSFDFGLPFFLGKTVFIGIVGLSGPTGPEAFIAPNGFVAF